MNKLTYYNELVKKFANKKCKLLTIYDDYSKMYDLLKSNIKLAIKQIPKELIIMLKR